MSSSGSGDDDGDDSVEGPGGQGDEGGKVGDSGKGGEVGDGGESGDDSEEATVRLCKTEGRGARSRPHHLSAASPHYEESGRRRRGPSSTRVSSVCIYTVTYPRKFFQCTK